MTTIIWVILSFLAGSLPFSVWVGRLALQKAAVAPARLVREGAARFAPLAQDAEIALAGAAEEGLPAVQVDEGRMRQVFDNLLTNALKYGEGKPVEIDVHGEGDRVMMAVRDHGIGISAEARARIFDRFERAVSSQHFAGFGLGLWIARRIVDEHGGRIAVESTPGEGSTFTVELPR